MKKIRRRRRTHNLIIIKNEAKKKKQIEKENQRGRQIHIKRTANLYVSCDKSE